MPFTVPEPAVLAMAMLLSLLVVTEIGPPSPPEPGDRLVVTGLEPTPPWLVAKMALPIVVQGVIRSPLGMDKSATLRSNVAFCMIETLPPAPAL